MTIDSALRSVATECLARPQLTGKLENHATSHVRGCHGLSAPLFFSGLCLGAVLLADRESRGYHLQ